MKKLIVFALVALTSLSLRAGDEDSLTKQVEDYIKLVDSVNKALKYETGVIKLNNGIAQMNIPQGFKFLNQEQSRYVLTELWGNPPSTTVLGMIWPENGGPFADSSYAFVITYDAIGYVKDADADKIDYDDLLKQMKEEEVTENKERVRDGYSTVHTVGWAQPPFYDKQNKVLHWAKELQFSGKDENTLNYEVRILGRKGVLSLNAVADVSELQMVKADIDKVLHIPTFTEGNAYADFDSNVDEVAAWTIGGLVAGKVLAKAGFFAIILKFGKFIIIGIAAMGGAIFKFFKRKKKDEYYQPSVDEQANS